MAVRTYDIDIGLEIAAKKVPEHHLTAFVRALFEENDSNPNMSVLIRRSSKEADND